jgi:Ni,Fe-hydrogenase III component G
VCLVVLDLSISKSKERERLRGERGRVLVARVTGQIKLTIFVFVSNDGNKNCFGSLCFYFLSLTRLERER